MIKHIVKVDNQQNMDELKKIHKSEIWNNSPRFL